MKSNLLFETFDSSKKKFWVRLESNLSPHACQFAALTNRPSGLKFFLNLKYVDLFWMFITSFRKSGDDEISIQ